MAKRIEQALRGMHRYGVVWYSMRVANYVKAG